MVATVEVAAPSGPVIGGQTMQLSAVARNAAGGAVAGKTFTWTSSSDAVATVGAGGMLTGVSAGTANVTASTDGKSGTVTVTILPVPIASLTVEPGSPQVEVGKAVQLTVTARDAAGNPLAGRQVTLVSSNAAVATVNAAMQVQGVAPGTATITATAEGKTATATVTVVPVPIASLTLEPGSPQVEVGKSVQLTVTARDAAGNALAGRQVTLITSNMAVATVNAAQQVQGVAPGTATITATAEGKTATATVTVVPVPIASLTLEPGSLQVEVGKSAQLTVTARDAAGNVLAGRQVTLITSNVAVATVNAAQQVQGVSPGNAMITATAEGKAAIAVVTVVPVPVASVTVTPSPVSVEVGATQQLTATLRDADGNVLSGRTVSWSTNSAAFVQVSASGVVTGIASGGPFPVTATAEGKTGTAQVTVLPQQPGSILVTRDEVPHSSLSNAVVRIAGPDGLLRERQMGTALSLVIDQLPAGPHTITMLEVGSRPDPDGPSFTYRALNNNRVVTVPSGGQATTHFAFELASGAVALKLSGVPAEYDGSVPCGVYWAQGAASFAYTTSAGPTAGPAAGLAEVRCFTFGFEGDLYDPSPQAQTITVPASTTPITVSVTYTRRP
ncbi:Ig-like domain-containing protein [Longimicrobium sp.]|uniref:Ig-like domain-containing protein n=1 Tax=Longimicrobium sp. TaxID=2029185 RepID=UPI002F94D6C7